MKAVLKRMETSDQGTFGRIVLGSLALFTGELPWRGNLPNISCIPAGQYRAVMTHSPRFGRKLYLVAPVDHRDGVRVHPANLMGSFDGGFKSQLNGCIALGEKIGWMDKQKALLLSQPAVRRLEEFTGGNPFDLEIIDV